MMNDVVSGSMAYNRLSMQISQSMLFIVDIFDDFDDFLLTLDYFDDITVFENGNMDGNVSYYQLKTDEKVTITSIINKKWLHKLYNHIVEVVDGSEPKIYLIAAETVTHNRKKL